MTIRELHAKGIGYIRRNDEPNGRYISCPSENFIFDACGNPTIFYCNLHDKSGRIIKYGFKVDVDKDDYCEYERIKK